MIRLLAVALGYAVPRRDFNATVHSVFPEAANLQSRKGGRLLTLVTADCADLPQGIRLDVPAGFSFEKTLDPGDRIVCQNGVLGDEHGRLSIDLRNVKRWKCRLPEMDVYVIHMPVVAAWSSVWHALNERQARCEAEIRASELSGVDHPNQTRLTKMMSSHIGELVNAVRNLDPSAETSAAGLIGLGPGLTPSGDDFLVGFLTGLRCTTGKRGDRLAYLSEVGKMVDRLSNQTNDISRTYLFHATHGQVSSRLAALAQAIARAEDSVHLQQVAENAMQVGHSSGMETVTGLLFGLSTWGNGYRID